MTNSPRFRVTAYLEAMPQRTGSGAHLRFYSNIRAYLDAGAEIHLVIATDGPVGYLPPEFTPASVRVVPLERRAATVWERVSFRIGLVNHAAFAYFFPAISRLGAAARREAREHPGTIHHFEGEHFAAAIPFVPGARTIWSLHDLPSVMMREVRLIQAELGENGLPGPIRRESRFLGRAERLMAYSSSLVMCISDSDRMVLQDRWRVGPVLTLPMSIPDETRKRHGGWLGGGKLRLLHLGRTAHLPSFRSLQFLLESVFPALPPELLARLELLVVGDAEGTDPRSRHIRSLAARYPGVVRMFGFVADVSEMYRQADLQIVAATAATGLRTRIIESFAWGLPVISTSVAALGILGLRPQENIVIADTADAFHAAFEIALTTPERLASLSDQGRELYDQAYSRPVVASVLRNALSRFF